jgi:predicted ester cyclase
MTREAGHMPSSDNGPTLRRFIEDVDPSCDVGALPEYVHDDVVLPSDIFPNGRQGLEGLREHILALSESFEWVNEVQDLIEGGDKVVARTVVRGRQLGEFMGLPASGRDFAIDEIMVAQFRGGKIARIWRIADLHSLFQQLDVAAA